MKQRRGPEENFRASVGEAGIIMTKFWKAAVAVGCTFAVAIGFTACDFGETKAKSAYQVAVDNGFKGTEADWLKSLHGADGGDGVRWHVNDSRRIHVSTSKRSTPRRRTADTREPFLNF